MVLKETLKRYFHFILIVVILGILLAYIEVFVIKKGGSVIDALSISAGSNTSISKIKSQLFQFTIVLFISFATQFLLVLLFAYTRKKVLFYAQKLMFRHLLYIDPHVFYRYQKGDIQERITSNVQALSMFFNQTFLDLVRNLAFLLITIYVVFKIRYIFSLIFAASFLLFLITSIWFATFVQKIFQRYYESEAKKRSFLIEVLNGFLSIKTLIKSYNFFYHKYCKILGKNTERMFQSDIVLFTSLFVYVVFLGLTVLILFTIGTHLVYARIITIGSFVSVVVLFISSSNSFNKLNQAISNIKSNFAALKRSETFFNEQEEICDGDVFKHIHNIKAENISYAYEDTKYILNNINLSINEGEFIGIKGESGSGKTTLLYILSGILRPTKGKLYVNNKELEEEMRCAFRKHIGFLPQEPFIIEDTLKENILFGEDYDEEKFIKVLKDAGLLTFFQKYDKNPNMWLKEGGKNLSQGEKQRIHLARILYRDPDVYMFDEPTSSVDAATEKIIIQTMHKLHQRGKTIIVVSHKPAPLKGIEKIYELKNGQLELLLIKEDKNAQNT